MKSIIVITFISFIATTGIAQQNAMAYFRAAQDKADNKDFAGAIDDCTKCLALPDAATATIPFGFFHHSCLRDRAQAYESMKEYSKALADYTLLTESNSTEFQEENFRYYAPQAKMLAELNRYDEALAAHNKAIAALPYDFSYAQRAETYRKMKDYTKAIEDYNLAIKIRKSTIDSFPESEENYLERGQTILLAGWPKKLACADFQAAKNIFTKHTSSSAAGQAKLKEIEALIDKSCPASLDTTYYYTITNQQDAVAMDVSNEFDDGFPRLITSPIKSTDTQKWRFVSLKDISDHGDGAEVFRITNKAIGEDYSLDMRLAEKGGYLIRLIKNINHRAQYWNVISWSNGGYRLKHNNYLGFELISATISMNDGTHNHREGIVKFQEVILTRDMNSLTWSFTRAEKINDANIQTVKTASKPEVQAGGKLSRLLEQGVTDETRAKQKQYMEDYNRRQAENEAREAAIKEQKKREEKQWLENQKRYEESQQVKLVEAERIKAKEEQANRTEANKEIWSGKSYVRILSKDPKLAGTALENVKGVDNRSNFVQLKPIDHYKPAGWNVERNSGQYWILKRTRRETFQEAEVYQIVSELRGQPMALSGNKLATVIPDYKVLAESDLNQFWAIDRKDDGSVVFQLAHELGKPNGNYKYFTGANGSIFVQNEPRNSINSTWIMEKIIGKDEVAKQTSLDGNVDLINVASNTYLCAGSKIIGGDLVSAPSLTTCKQLSGDRFSFVKCLNNKTYLIILSRRDGNQYYVVNGGNLVNMKSDIHIGPDTNDNRYQWDIDFRNGDYGFSNISDKKMPILKNSRLTFEPFQGVTNERWKPR